MTVKRMFHYSAFALLTTLLMLFSGCRKKQAPTLTTSEVTAITPTTAKSGGNITSDGRSGVSVRGVCWSANPNPAIENDTRTIDGSGAGSR